MNQYNSKTNRLWVEALSSVWRLLQQWNTDKGTETNELASAREINVYVKLVGTIKCCKNIFLLESYCALHRHTVFFKASRIK